MTRLLGSFSSCRSSRISSNIESIKFLLVSFCLMPLAACGARVGDYAGRWQGHIAPLEMKDRLGRSYNVASIVLEKGTFDQREMKCNPHKNEIIPLVDKKNRAAALSLLPSGTLIDISGKLVIDGIPMDPMGQYYLGQPKAIIPPIYPNGDATPDDPHTSRPPVSGGIILQYDSYKILVPATAPSATEQE